MQVPSKEGNESIADPIIGNTKGKACTDLSFLAFICIP